LVVEASVPVTPEDALEVADVAESKVFVGQMEVREPGVDVQPVAIETAARKIAANTRRRKCG